MNEPSEYTRLHISPLTAALLPALLPPSVLPNARNISYHTIQTFPEKAYGFLELPTMDATKLKKKLHGSILKGTKVRIETAHPNADLRPEQPEPEKPKREKKKRKRDEIPGVEIERSVKRGWTEPVLSKKEVKERKRVKSKHTTGKECLFKTVLPPNVASKDTIDKKKRRDRKTLVHEFEKTEKYSTFLRDPGLKNKGRGAKEFVEGKGWVDEEGNIVEEVTLKSALKSKMAIYEKEATGKKDISENSSSEEKVEKTESALAAEEPSATSTSGSSSDEESEEVDEDDSTSDSDSPSAKSVAETAKKSSRPASSAGLTISIPNSAITSTPVLGQVHPLEALYKRSIADPNVKPVESAFSFFGAGKEEEEYEARDQVPLTPYTQRDFEFRGMRSAAPTPDTAHASKRFKWPTDRPDSAEDSGDEEAPSSPVRKPDLKGKAKATEDSEEPKEEQSDFAKLFYEKRGEMTRAWKKRRKVVSKEKRQRENRKGGGRA